MGKRNFMIIMVVLVLSLGLIGCSKASSEGEIKENGNVVINGESVEGFVSEIDDESFPNWGLTLSVEDVTPYGLTLVCTQSGGEPTGELQTGSDYNLIVLKDGTWQEVPTIIEDYGWTAEAYLIAKNDVREFEIKWEWLHGKLPAGTYRLVKSFMDFRETGNYDTFDYWVEFEIKLEAEALDTDLQDGDFKKITIDLSTWEETHMEGDSVTPLNLKIVSKEENGVDWANDWYEQMNLSLPMLGDEWNHFYDEVYEYQWIGEYLEIYEKESGKHLYTLEYPTDKWYINGNNAYLKDGIFYGASVTNGYAQPDTCFMFAYDLNNEKLLWRSASQSYNTMNFVVKGDIIICGYGFTDEKDYLYQINRNTGEIIDKMELKKMPDLLVEQDGKLYVHTYSYNYVIEFD